MARVIFLNPNPRNLIAGGVKTVYRQAEVLSELGIQAYVFQPDGPPDWLHTSAKVMRELPVAPSSEDILVFPENPFGWLADLAQTPLAACKVLFCQAHYYVFQSAIPPERYSALGFSRVVCCSNTAKGFLERIFHLRDVAVAPCYIDRELFYPRPKNIQIAYLPHKLPHEAAMIRKMLGLKYPRLATVPWYPIENLKEWETAELLGQTAVYISLPLRESFGLVALEAMASGAIVVGFDGYGGKEYASHENGLWYSLDQIEDTVDALAEALSGVEQGVRKFQEMRYAGLAAAGRYGKGRTKEALMEIYGPLTGLCDGPNHLS
jgi:Glycosyl transferases group 1